MSQTKTINTRTGQRLEGVKAIAEVSDPVEKPGQPTQKSQDKINKVLKQLNDFITSDYFWNFQGYTSKVRQTRINSFNQDESFLNTMYKSYSKTKEYRDKNNTAYTALPSDKTISTNQKFWKKVGRTKFGIRYFFGYEEGKARNEKFLEETGVTKFNPDGTMTSNLAKREAKGVQKSQIGFKESSPYFDMFGPKYPTPLIMNFIWRKGWSRDDHETYFYKTYDFVRIIDGVKPPTNDSLPFLNTNFSTSSGRSSEEYIMKTTKKNSQGKRIPISKSKLRALKAKMEETLVDDLKAMMNNNSRYSPSIISSQFGTNDSPYFPQSQAPEVFKYSILSDGMPSPIKAMNQLTNKLVKAFKYLYGDDLTDLIQMPKSTYFTNYSDQYEATAKAKLTYLELKEKYPKYKKYDKPKIYLFLLARRIIQSKWYFDPITQQFNKDHLKY
jgi:hypothetical protein